MPTLAISGAYVGVNSLKAAANFTANDRDPVILEHLLAASRQFDMETERRFFPYTGTNYYRWPPLHVAASWEVWLEDDLLSVTTLQAAATGLNAVPVTLTHYFLEPQFYGPPYNRLEIDLSNTDVLTSGPTSQRSIALTGMWGYTSTTVPAGTLAASMASGDTSLTPSTPALIEPGDVLLIDSEAIFVNLTLASPPQTLQRGVNGTTAAAHNNGAAIVKYQAPADIRRVIRADAIGSFQQDLSNWSRNVGAGEMAVEWQGKAIKSLRQEVVDRYRRRHYAAV